MEQQVANDTAKFCCHCGARVRADGSFCSACGQPASESPAIPELIQTTQPKKSKKKWWIAIIAVVAAVAIALSCFLIFRKTDYEEAFDTFLTVFFEGDFTDVYETIPAEALPKGCPKDLNTNPEYSQEWIEEMQEDVYSYCLEDTRELSEFEVMKVAEELYEETGCVMNTDEAYEFRLYVETEGGDVYRLADNGDGVNFYISFYVVKVNNEWYVLAYKRDHLMFATQRLISNFKKELPPTTLVVN